jgi:ABC-type sugar transport system permease subunit
MKKIKTIKTKLLLAFGAVLFLSLLLSGWSIYFIYKILDYEAVNVAFDDVNIRRLQLRRAEKNFLLRDLTKPELFEKGESNYFRMFKSFDLPLKLTLDSLGASKTVQSLHISKELAETKNHLTEYTETFYALVEKIRKRGFKDWGDEGELRAAIHAVEKDNVADKSLILELRKHEKDFFLRKDLQYKEKFNAAIEDLKSSLSAKKEGAVDDAMKNIDLYQAKFHQIVEAEMAIGLNEKEGFLAKLQTAVDKLDPITIKMTSLAKISIDEVVNRTIVLIALAVLIQLIMGTVLAVMFSNNFTRSTTQIKDNIVQLAEGTYPDKTEVTGVDEFGGSQQALNNLIERVKTAASFAEKVGNGELTAQYDENYRNDVLAMALLNMHGKLVKTAEEDKRRNWATQGLADFGEILRNDQQNFEELSNKIISYLVKYLQANQGALFIMNDENDSDVHLELAAIYAWGKKKFIKTRIEAGEGVAGQTWQEGQTVYLRQVPTDYVRITSGLGEANPRSVLVVPLKVSEKVYGVIEIASLKEYEKFEIEFVEKLAENVASAVSSAKVNDRTKRLLAQTQQQAEEMRAQEEEMRQNMEELSATQEEMGRKEKEYLKRIQELELIARSTKQNGIQPGTNGMHNGELVLK